MICLIEYYLLFMMQPEDDYECELGLGVNPRDSKYDIRSFEISYKLNDQVWNNRNKINEMDADIKKIKRFMFGKSIPKPKRSNNSCNSCNSVQAMIVILVILIMFLVGSMLAIAGLIAGIIRA